MYSLEIIPDIIIDKIKSYVIFTPKKYKKFKKAVNLWCNNKKLAFKKYGHISLWNTINITEMNDLFSDHKSFNSVISSWDVSNVTDMSRMFSGAKKFNQPLNNWNVSNLTDMNCMFKYANVFNQPINDWNVSSVENIKDMFDGT